MLQLRRPSGHAPQPPVSPLLGIRLTFHCPRTSLLGQAGLLSSPLNSTEFSVRSTSAFTRLRKLSSFALLVRGDIRPRLPAGTVTRPGALHRPSLRFLLQCEVLWRPALLCVPGSHYRGSRTLPLAHLSGYSPVLCPSLRSLPSQVCEYGALGIL